MESARVMMGQAGLPEHYWAEAVATGCSRLSEEVMGK